jgi:hypothetical protein
VEGFFLEIFLSLGDKKFWKLLFLGENLTNFAIKKLKKNCQIFETTKLTDHLKKEKEKEKKEKKKNTNNNESYLILCKNKSWKIFKIFLRGNIFLSPHQSKLYILYGIVCPWLFMLIV